MSKADTLSAKNAPELSATGTKPVDAPDANAGGFFEKLYNGNGGFRIVQNRGRLYGVLVAVLVACLISIVVRGFSLGIDFEGGTRMTCLLYTSDAADE